MITRLIFQQRLCIGIAVACIRWAWVAKGFAQETRCHPTARRGRQRVRDASCGKRDAGTATCTLCSVAKQQRAVRENPAFIQLRRIDAAREVASVITQSPNKIFLNSDSLMLNNLGDLKTPPAQKKGWLW